MKESRSSDGEGERLATLEAARILDTLPEERFDRITRLARKAFDVPIALVGLLDSRREWFKSRQGLDVGEWPRAISFCAHSLLGTDGLVVPDASRDDRFRDNPLVVSDPGIRFYAACAIAIGGHRLGTLSIADRKPREFSLEDRSSLRDLAALAEAELHATASTTSGETADAELLRLRMAVEASGEVIFLTDRDGTIQYVNPQFTSVYEWTPGEVVGKVTPRILKSGQLGAEVYEGFWKNLLAGNVNRGEMVNRTKSGRLVRTEGSANPIVDGRGTIVGFLAIQRDVTERHELSEQLVQAQKMEAVGRLAGGVAHDFNNLLSAILLYTDFALGAIGENDAVRADLEEVRRAGERATNLTRQLLLLSRRRAARPEVVDLNTAVANVEKLLRRLLGEDIDFCIDAGPDLPCITADPGHIEQILMNLAVNARDAMPGGGRIRIETGQVDIAPAAEAGGVLEPGKYVVLEFSDTGCGMPPEILARAFDPFFTTKPEGKGTGLGLSIVRSIVQQMKGRVGITSSPGEGTRLTFHLPATGEARASSAPPERRATGRGGTVLLVEDDDGVRTVARRLLVAGGFQVLEARNVGEALLLSEHHATAIDVLLTDIVLPQLSGVEGAQRLQALRPSLRVVYMSGHSEPHDPLDLEATGAVFLPKPFSRETLLAAIERAFGS